MLQGASFKTSRPPWLDRWADFAVTMTAESLPADVVARTKQVLFDCIGAIAAGAQEPEMQRLTARLCRASAATTPPVIGAGRRAAVGTAAFLNGTAGTMLEIDEGNQFARGHPGIHVVPAVLAVAEAARQQRRRGPAGHRARLRNRLAHRHRLEAARHHASARHLGHGRRGGGGRETAWRDAASRWWR